MLHSALLLCSLTEFSAVESSCTSIVPPAVASERTPHGPEKPPPDDGYDFKDGNSSNFLGKLGLVMVLSSGATGGVALFSDADRRQTMGLVSGGLFLGGVTLLLIERAT